MYEYSAISHVQQQQKMYSTYMYYNTVSQYNTNRKRITYSNMGSNATADMDLVFDLSRSRYNQEFLVLLDRKACFISKTFMMYVIHILSWPQLFTLLLETNQDMKWREQFLGGKFKYVRKSVHVLTKTCLH